MLLSNNVLKWVMRFYPPLFFQRIWVKSISADFTEVKVTVYKSLLNQNYNRTLFGGTIFSAADPFYSIMHWQLLKKQGLNTIGWLKSAEIQYIKPGHGNLQLTFKLSKQEVDDCIYTLKTVGKFVHTYQTEAVNSEGIVCAVVSLEVWIRLIE